MSKEIRNLKTERAREQEARSFTLSGQVRDLDFDLRAYFGFRSSEFGFFHCTIE